MQNWSSVAVSGLMAQCFGSFCCYCLRKIIHLLHIVRKTGMHQIQYGRQCVSTWKVNAQLLSAVQSFSLMVGYLTCAWLYTLVPVRLEWVQRNVLKLCSGSDQSRYIWKIFRAHLNKILFSIVIVAHNNLLWQTGCSHSNNSKCLSWLVWI